MSRKTRTPEEQARREKIQALLPRRFVSKKGPAARLCATGPFTIIGILLHQLAIAHLFLGKEFLMRSTSSNA